MQIASTADLATLEATLTSLLRPQSCAHSAFARTDPLVFHSQAYTRFRLAALRHLTLQPSGLAAGDLFLLSDVCLRVVRTDPELLVVAEAVETPILPDPLDWMEPDI